MFAFFGADIRSTNRISRSTSSSRPLISSWCRQGTGHGLADEEFERRGITRNVKLRIPHFASVGYLLHETDLITTVPRRLVNRCAGPFGLSFVPVPFELPSIPINLFWSARYHRDPANQWLRTMMVETFNKEEAARQSAGPQTPKVLAPTFALHPGVECPVPHPARRA
jgi:DNA-binding transcriptional LysR family regulator